MCARIWADIAPKTLRLMMDDLQQKPFLGRATYRDLQEENDELRANCQTLSRLVDVMRMEMERAAGHQHLISHV